MMFQVIWLAASYAAIFAIGMTLVESDHIAASFLFFIGIPSLRIYRRFLDGKGYWLIRHEGEVGSIPGYGGRVTRRDQPRRFKFCLLCEVLVIAFLGFMLTYRLLFGQ